MSAEDAIGKVPQAFALGLVLHDLCTEIAICFSPRVNQRPLPRPLGQPASRRVPRSNKPRDRLVITPRQHRRTTQRPRPVIRLKNLHRFLRFLDGRPPQITR